MRTSKNPNWYLLVEYALNEIFVDNGKGDEVKAGFLFKPFRELGVPPELISKIELTLIGFAQQTRMLVEQSRLERPGCFRVFCQKKVIDYANAGKTSRPRTSAQTMKNVPISNHFDKIMNRGWGFFIIERTGDYAGSSDGSRSLVDLYLYEEGV